MKKYNYLFIYLLISVFCTGIIFFLYPVYHPNISIHPEITISGIKKKTEAFLQDQNISTEKGVINVYTAKNQILIKGIQRKFGLRKANRLFREFLPAYYYEVNLVPETEITLSSDMNKKDKRAGEEKLPENNLLLYDFHGKVINFNRKITDSTSIKIIPLIEAKQQVLEFAKKFTGVYSQIINIPSKDTTIRIANDAASSGNQLYKEIHRMQWNTVDSATSTKILIEASVTGHIITHFNVEYSVTGLAPAEDENSIIQISEAIIYLLILLSIGITGYKKIRAFEIGFKNAVLMGVVAGLSFAAFIAMQMGSDFKAEAWIPIIATFIFWGSLIFVVWAVSEAVVRELWKDKFNSFDIIMKGDLLHSKIGESIIIGGSWGINMLALFLCLIALLEKFVNLQIMPGDEVLRMYSNKYLFLYFFNFDIHLSSFYIIVFIAFVFTSLNKKYFKLTSAAVLTVLLWGLAHKGLVSPYYYSILIHFFIGAIVLYLFLKHDIFTALFSLFTFSFLINFLSLFYQKNPAFVHLQYIPLFIIVVILIYAVATLSTKNLITDLHSIVPVYAVHITERQRLQRELEIAREVQMSFLPRKNPDVLGIDIASRCIPAMEVGGDYYDFIEFDNNKLGVVVGDVSGKGTQAAFYMTLSKGFLKAIAKTSSSPKDVLIKMNNMFYENVDRGTFITMVIAVFDLKNKSVVFSSAGHNPIIYRNSYRNKNEYLQSKGMALGLEKGDIFTKTITEKSMDFSADDIFVLYTDGFTEAMNKKREEYGDEKLLEIITENNGFSSQDILETYFAEVKNFIGKAVQHDDMSMVVVKIK